VPAGQFQSRQAGQRCRIPVRSELRRAEERAPTAVTSAGSIRGSAARSCGLRPVSNSRSASPRSQSAASPVGDIRGGAVAELDGRPVVVSGGVDKTVRIWDLATGSPVGDPFAGQAGCVTAVASQKDKALYKHIRLFKSA
jgi:WD40 repeat protein